MRSTLQGLRLMIVVRRFYCPSTRERISIAEDESAPFLDEYQGGGQYTTATPISLRQAVAGLLALRGANVWYQVQEQEVTE